jgi:uncharacterized membrane protein YfcA
MSRRKANYANVKVVTNSIFFIIIFSLSIWYYKQIPDYHWTLIVPWFLTAVMFVALRIKSNSKSNRKVKSKIKRYM